ncbi:hypothetical protein AG1IA_08814 [Rhizoctonia solani AG-1 IA]|uniref:Uncharacterized protein n=1 Tax=Thanatephorus cucumeris (strain AG1-IA) TaxID=983506 RepID=L8WLD2_THACA|nr:hypothetical protein AG1IA_08814 [Rhizoctonia solani AG-1 IA]
MAQLDLVNLLFSVPMNCCDHKRMVLRGLGAKRCYILTNTKPAFKLSDYG